MLHILARLLLAMPLLASATSQSPDAVRVEGQTRYTFSTPLDEAHSQAPALWARLQSALPSDRCSTHWRGYTAGWELVADELRLTELASFNCHQGSRAIPLEVLEPGASGPIRATWFSGELSFEVGPRVAGPCGYSPTCPSGHEVWVFEKGRRVRSEYRPFSPAGGAGQRK